MGLPSGSVGVCVCKFYDGRQRDLSEPGYLVSWGGHYRRGRTCLLCRLAEIGVEKVMNQNIKNVTFYGTTVLSVRHLGNTVMAGDGQVTLGATVVKQKASKVRRLYNDKVLAGFAGSAADSFALYSRFESKLEAYRGNLERSVVELAKDWRTDRILRRLEAMLVVADQSSTFLLSGTGDVIEPDDGIVGIGSGGAYAVAAAKSLAQNTDLEASVIANQAMQVAAEICIYTNTNVTIEEL